MITTVSFCHTPKDKTKAIENAMDEKDKALFGKLKEWRKEAVGDDFPKLIRINPVNLKRSLRNMQIKVRLYSADKINDEKLTQSAQSITAYLKYYNTYELRQDLIEKGVIH